MGYVVDNKQLMHKKDAPPGASFYVGVSKSQQNAELFNILPLPPQHLF